MTCSRINSIREASDMTVTARVRLLPISWSKKQKTRKADLGKKNLSMKTLLKGFCVWCLSGSAAPSGWVFMANGQDNWMRAFTMAVGAQSGWQFLFKNNQKPWQVRGNVLHLRWQSTVNSWCLAICLHNHNQQSKQLPYFAYSDTTQWLVQLPVSIAHCLSLQNALPGPSQELLHVSHSPQWLSL